MTSAANGEEALALLSEEVPRGLIVSDSHYAGAESGSV